MSYLSISKYFSDEKNNRKMLYLGLALIVAYVFISYSTSLLAFNAPTQDQRWDTSVQLNASQYTRGARAGITVDLQEVVDYFSFTSPEDITWAILVLDFENKPIYVAYYTYSNADGDLSIPTSFIIPDDAANGIAKIRIIAWTNLLPSGTTRTYRITEGSFVVI